ncbi:MAG: PASTA domain-containing protein [Actinomycetota bacterium]|nr:PASTA domain-containing protein [Actinomycetota bacterium]
MDDTLADPLTGRLLDGRYAVTARIAHGGMATVYLAMDTRLDREVALKVMHAELARDDDFVRRFIGEAKSVARLSHQNVVAVYDQGADGPVLYLAMEYVPGRTLKEMLRDNGRLPPAVALEIMTGVLGGLAAAHASGIVHRDVKPENVLLTADGRVKVADFGLARALTATGHTRTGLLIGTVAYVPPEQVTGDSTGPRGDVYSAGVMLFQMLTGRLPFTGDTPLSVAYQHVNTDVPPPSTLTPGLPSAVDDLVLAATSRDPARRPADASEFSRAVRQVSAGLHESTGLTGMIGAGVQGLEEAPWLDLTSPAATNGWWAHSGAMPAASGPGTGPAALVAGFADSQAGTGQLGTGPFGTGQLGTGEIRVGQFGPGPRDDVSSHTLVVHREDGGRSPGGREPLLQRWLFSPRLLIIMLVLVLGVGLGLGAWWLTSGRYTQVPRVAGDSVSQATAVLTADGFKVAKGAQRPSNTVKKGIVLSTSPAGRVAKGTVVAIVVSSGPFTSKVPDVQHDTLAAAQAALQRVHLVPTTQKVGSSSPVGTVIGTNPPAGTSWPQDKPVTIRVSSGLALPSFAGQNVQAAQQWAAQHGGTLQQQPDNNSEQPAGTITGQQPAAGATFQQGQAITVNVSTGPQLVAVPSPIGMSTQQATQLLQQAGFQVQVNKYGPFDKVFDFSPVSQAPRGSTVTLDVGY